MYFKFVKKCQEISAGKSVPPASKKVGRGKFPSHLPRWDRFLAGAPPLRLALARTLPLDWPWNFKWGTELECASGRCQCSLSVALGARRGPSPSSRLIPVGARYAPNDRHPSSSSTDVRRSQLNVQSPILACQCTVHFRFEVLLVSTQPGVSRLITSAIKAAWLPSRVSSAQCMKSLS